MANVTISGTGEVLRAGQHICGVQYRLQQRDTVSEQAKIAGEIVVSRAERMSVDVLNSLGSGGLFTLQLDSGRQLEVFFNQVDPLAGTWRVVVGPGNMPLE